MMALETSKLKIAGFRVIYGPSTVGRVYTQAAAELNDAGLPVDLRYCQPVAAGMLVPPAEWLKFAREEADAVFSAFRLSLRHLVNFLRS